MAAKKKTGKTKSKKIIMAEHEMKVKVIGLSERATRMMVRAAIILVPVIIFIFWMARSSG